MNNIQNTEHTKMMLYKTKLLKQYSQQHYNFKKQATIICTALEARKLKINKQYKTVQNLCQRGIFGRFELDNNNKSVILTL